MQVSYLEVEASAANLLLFLCSQHHLLSAGMAENGSVAVNIKISNTKLSVIQHFLYRMSKIAFGTCNSYFTYFRRYRYFDHKVKHLVLKLTRPN